MSVTIIINPISGGVRPEQARARAELASAVVDTDGETAEVFVTEARGHARELARAAVRRGTRLVISWGGDGTLNEVASALAFQEVPLGLVPAGSGNGLARELGVNLDPRAGDRRRDPRAAPDHRSGTGGRSPLCQHRRASASMPTSPRSSTSRVTAAADLPDTRPSPRGRWPATCPRPTPSRPRKAAGCRARFSSPWRTPRNSATGPESRHAPSSTTDCSIWLSWRSAPGGGRSSACRGSSTAPWSRSPVARFVHIQQATIESDRPMVFHVDGEPVEAGTRLQVRVLPAALRVAVR